MRITCPTPWLMKQRASDWERQRPAGMVGRSLRLSRSRFRLSRRLRPTTPNPAGKMPALPVAAASPRTPPLLKTLPSFRIAFRIAFRIPQSAFRIPQC